MSITDNTEDSIYQANILQGNQKTDSEIIYVISEPNLYSELEEELHIKIERYNSVKFVKDLEQTDTVEQLKLLGEKYKQTVQSIEKDIESIEYKLQNVERKKEYIAMRIALNVLQNLLTKQQDNNHSIKNIKENFKQTFEFEKKNINQQVKEFFKNNSNKINGEAKNLEVRTSKLSELTSKISRCIQVLTNGISHILKNNSQRRSLSGQNITTDLKYPRDNFVNLPSNISEQTTSSKQNVNKREVRQQTHKDDTLKNNHNVKRKEAESSNIVIKQKTEEPRTKVKRDLNPEVEHNFKNKKQKFPDTTKEEHIKTFDQISKKDQKLSEVKANGNFYKDNFTQKIDENQYQRAAERFKQNNIESSKSNFFDKKPCTNCR